LTGRVPAGGLGGAVLCGGASRRMGTDKALLAVAGRPMALRVADALAAAGAAPVLAVGGDGASLRALGLATVADERPGEGPLAAVATALRALAPALADGDPAAAGRTGPASGAGEGAALVVACDLVHPSAAALGATAEALAAAPGADVAVPVAGGRHQWAQAAWRLRALPALDACLERGERAIHRAVAAAGLVVMEVPGLRPADLADADTPADLPASAAPDAGGRGHAH
jgi:molybdopterin-guanine dinucleotide biosynthesis protein A